MFSHAALPVFSRLLFPGVLQPSEYSKSRDAQQRFECLVGDAPVRKQTEGRKRRRSAGVGVGRRSRRTGTRDEGKEIQKEGGEEGMGWEVMRERRETWKGLVINLVDEKRDRRERKERKWERGRVPLLRISSRCVPCKLCRSSPGTRGGTFTSLRIIGTL